MAEIDKVRVILVGDSGTCDHTRSIVGNLVVKKSGSYTDFSENRSNPKR